jgi:hypothetical protein
VEKNAFSNPYREQLGPTTEFSRTKTSVKSAGFWAHGAEEVRVAKSGWRRERNWNRTFSGSPSYRQVTEQANGPGRSVPGATMSYGPSFLDWALHSLRAGRSGLVNSSATLARASIREGHSNRTRDLGLLPVGACSQGKARGPHSGGLPGVWRGSFSDPRAVQLNVRFSFESRHQRLGTSGPLLANSGHQKREPPTTAAPLFLDSYSTATG